MNRNLATGYAFLVFSILLWSGNTVVGRAAMLGDVPPVALNFWRWVGALVLLAPVTLPDVWAKRELIRRRWRYFAAFGVVSVGCFNTFYYLGLQTTTAVQASLIQSILPVLVLLMGAAFAATPVSGRQGIGVVLSVAGAVTIVVRGDSGLLAALSLSVGDLWCLAAVSVWAIQTFMLRWKPPEIGIRSFMTVVIAIGIVFVTPFYVLEMASGRFMPVTVHSVGSILYLAVLASAVASTMYNEGVVRVGPAVSGYFGNLFPVFSALLAVMLLGEAGAWYHLAGGALVLAGIYFATVARRGARAAAETAR